MLKIEFANDHHPLVDVLLPQVVQVLPGVLESHENLLQTLQLLVLSIVQNVALCAWPLWNYFAHVLRLVIARPGSVLLEFWQSYQLIGVDAEQL